MGNDADQHDKFEAALSFCKTKLNRARGEERRKVHTTHVHTCNTFKARYKHIKYTVSFY